MRTHTIKQLQAYGIAVVALLVCLFTENSFAMTHVVMFGGSLGFVYSPSSFSAKVGDTVKWEGAFGTHPLSSTTIPASAASWHMASGGSFSYVITAAGTYNYYCDLHFSLGMMGSFTATAATGIDARMVTSPEHFSMNTVTVQGRNMVQFYVPDAGTITLKLFDLTGREISTVLSRPLPAGVHEAAIGNFPAGLYFLKLFAGGDILVRTVHIVG